MKTLIAAIYAALTVMLFAVPSSAGTPYCGTHYQQGYVYPAGNYPTTYSQTYYAPLNQQYEPNPHYYGTFRVADDVRTARLIEEAVAAQANKDKAEYAAQQLALRQAAKEANDEAFKQQMLAAITALQQRMAVAPLPVADPETARLRAENEQMKAALQQIIQQKGTQPPPAGAQALPLPPDPPKAQAQPNAPKNPVFETFKQAVGTSCMPCHGEGKTPRLNLTDPAKLTVLDLDEAKQHMKGVNGRKIMPPDGKQVSAETFFAFDELMSAKIQSGK